MVGYAVVVSAAVILTRVADWNLTHRLGFATSLGRGRDGGIGGGIVVPCDYRQDAYTVVCEPNNCIRVSITPRQLRLRALRHSPRQPFRIIDGTNRDRIQCRC
jgi:hypothetical protein